MGTKHPKIENSDNQVVWSLEEAKSYTCSFCRKGFSNAQALGGHMNIHRKDRAKLRESSEENTVSSDIMPDLDHSHVSEIILESSEDRISSSPRKKPCKSSEEDAIEEVKAQQGSSETEMELDLELRLGKDPHQETSSKTTTREFFR